MSKMKPLMDLAEVVSDVNSKYSELLWTQYTVGMDFGIDEAHKASTAVYKDKKNFDIICEAREMSTSPEDRRRADIAFKGFEKYHLSKELNDLNDKIFEVKSECSKVLNTFRNTIDGKQVTGTEISDILTNNPDRELRKKALMCRSQVNQPLVDAGFIKLINLRKEYAKCYGAESFTDMALEDGDLSGEIFKDWKDEVKKALPKTLEKKAAYAEKYLGTSDLRQWDSSFLAGKINPLENKDVDMVNFFEPMKNLYTKFGFDLGSMGITFDVFPREHKSEWGYHFTIKAGEDSRILANIDNKYTNFFVLLHEAGHGIHYKSVDPKDYWMNEGISGIISEGIANLFGYMAQEEIFYGEFFSDNIDQAREQFAASKEYAKIRPLDGINAILFDQELYKTEIKSLDDINELNWSMAKELNGGERYEGQPPWGFRIHHTTHPIYLHNYFMGDVTCEMLKKSFCEKNSVDKITEKPEEFGNFLKKEVIEVSGMYKYEDLFEKLAGKKFSLDYIL
jgi:oligoendopeptidase F